MKDRGKRGMYTIWGTTYDTDIKYINIYMHDYIVGFAPAGPINIINHAVCTTRWARSRSPNYALAGNIRKTGEAWAKVSREGRPGVRGRRNAGGIYAEIF